ncbi:MAG: Spy/CpxP family protein refolding chaperone [Alphaproteobacteria bacterium]|nr:Spy/CpxP family protein refolding chaperone [Alphaproteobacteria bacterium]
MTFTDMTRFAVVLVAAAVLMAASPYAGLEKRSIKALSPERIAALEAGAGAGYALAAELNGYPGPRHVLDLADALKLTPGQRAKTEALFSEMRRGAVALGRELIRQEAALEALFRDGGINETALSVQTAAIGATEARLRTTHLKYHIQMAGVLSAAQRMAYNDLRGYKSDKRGHSGHSGHGR